MLRRVLLWMATNHWLADRLPRMRFARRAASRFMPGEDLSSAVIAGQHLAGERIGAVLTRLGENVATLQAADEVRAHYLRVLGATREGGLPVEISVKLTQLGLDIDATAAEASVGALAVEAARDNRTVWVDMEGSAYTERTIALYERVKQRHPRTGVCLQAYLRRTSADVERLMPVQPAIRIVKGAYAEPRTAAYEDAEVDQNFRRVARALLERRAAGDDVRIVLGTHDARLIEMIAADAESFALPRSSLEIHVLYGVRADEQRKLAAEGYLVRTLISYGTAWYPWYMRRLAERPANVAFALRQLLP